MIQDLKEKFQQEVSISERHLIGYYHNTWGPVNADGLNNKISLQRTKNKDEEDF